ncbi:MAG: aminotransferase class I/II-fold pyridoxal phosphate-dependent enzyme [Clostridia bacterium]
MWYNIKMMPIVEMLNKYAQSNNIRLHMPGHKGDIEIESLKSVAKIDVTELSVTDNLYNPTGAIKESQQLYAELFGVKYAFFGVNGSTAGNLAFTALYDNYVVSRNCHRSIFNGLQLGKKETVVINNRFNRGKYLPLELEDVIVTIENSPLTQAVILTNPDYYGYTIPLEEIYDYLKSKGIKLFVDSAHGAHFGLSEKLPQNVMRNCDAAVVSTHKTLLALTQTAVVMCNDDYLAASLKDKLRLFTTTSPSFILLASIDYAREMASSAAADYERILNLRKKLEYDLKLSCDVLLEHNDDFTRLVLDLSRLNISGLDANTFMENNGLYFEMFDDIRLVAIITHIDKKDVFDKIYTACLKLYKAVKNNEIKKSNINFLKIEREQIYFPLQLNEVNSTMVLLKNAVGKIAAADAGVIPPCIPILLKGEKINSYAIEVLTTLMDSNCKNVYGVINGCVEVFE